MKKIILILPLICTINSLAQDASERDSSSVTIGAYADGYYSWYSNADHVVLQQHDCIGAYHNNFGLNIAQFTSAYNSNRLRGVATLHIGDIPAITWMNNYRFIQEANAGVRLAKRLWLDLGFFKTHVGTESFLPKDNLMSILSLGTFYGPFYQSGARLSYDTENDWHFEAHVLNGYNLHLDDNEHKTFGWLVSKKWSEKFFTSYSAIAGQENVGLLDDGYLLYQNILSNLVFSKLELQFGLDVAFANQWKTGQNWLPNPLISGLATAKFHVNEIFSVAFRGEVFNDPQSIISTRKFPTMLNGQSRVSTSSLEGDGLTIYGATLGLEYAPSKQGYVRLESRGLYDPNAIFADYPAGFSSRRTGLNPMLISRLQVLATIGFYFDKTFKFAQ